MNLILLFPQDLTDDSRAKVTGDRANHIFTLLKGKPGKQLKVGFVNGKIGLATVASSSKDEVEMLITLFQEPLPFLPITLLIALPRPQTLKKVLEATATFGIRKLVLMNADRVEQSFFQATLLKDGNYLKHVYLGLEQGGRTLVPEIEWYQSPISLKSLPDSLKLIAHPGVSTTLWQTTFMDHPDQDVCVGIGPEGGWTDTEMKKFENLGFLPISLGQTLHRVENAVTSLLAQIELVKQRPR